MKSVVIDRVLSCVHTSVQPVVCVCDHSLASVYTLAPLVLYRSLSSLSLSLSMPVCACVCQHGDDKVNYMLVTYTFSATELQNVHVHTVALCVKYKLSHTTV